jgi:hypothetical protein
MAYMRDKTGRRLDQFEVAPRGLSAFPGLVPCGSRSTWNLYNPVTATASDLQQLQFAVADVIARPVRNVRLVFDGWGWDLASLTELDYANSYTVKVGIKVVSTGAVVPVYFGNLRSGTVPAGGRLVSDPVPIVLNRGDQVTYRVLATLANGATTQLTGYVSALFTAAEGYEHGLTVTDKTLQTGDTIAARTAPTAAIVPNLLLGEPLTADPVVGLGGCDSIAAGFQDSNTMGTDGGYLRRALTGKVGFVRTASPSDLASNYSDPQKSPRRRSLMAGCTSIIDQDGINDIKGGGRTLAQLQAAKLANATFHASLGAKVFVCTLLPYAPTTTDAWATTAGQTVGAYESARTGYNQWLRAGAPIVAGAAVAPGTSGALLAGQAGHPIWHVFDPCSKVESATDSGKWAPQGRAVSDAAMTSGSGVLTSATAAFTTADLGKIAVVMGAGSSGGILWGYITVYTSATQVTLDHNAAATVSAAAATVDGVTGDGLHPIGAGHALCAQAIDTTLLV